MTFKLFPFLVALQTVVAGGAPQPRRLLETVSLSSGADLMVHVDFPTPGLGIPMAEGLCTVDVTVQATGAIGQGEPDVSYVFLLDESGSTNKFLGDIHSFFTSLTDALLSSGPTKNIGVVTFQNTSYIRSGLTTDSDDIKNAINTGTSFGTTNCREGLNSAGTVLSDASAGGTKVVVFAGDGKCTEGGENAAANALAAQGVIIQVLAIGSGVNCSIGSLGKLARNGGSCIEIQDISEFPTSDLVGTKLIEGDAEGTITSVDATDPEYTTGEKEFQFQGTKTYGKGSHLACASAKGDDALEAEGPREVEECIVFNVIDNQIPSAFCNEGPNPSGKKPNSKNQDGFFILGGSDNCGVATYEVVDSVSGYHFGPYPAGTTFKYTEAPGAPITEKTGSGDVDWKLTGNGDAYVLVTDIYGNTNIADCLVPPRPSRRLQRPVRPRKTSKK